MTRLAMALTLSVTMAAPTMTAGAATQAPDFSGTWSLRLYLGRVTPEGTAGASERGTAVAGRAVPSTPGPRAAMTGSLGAARGPAAAQTITVSQTTVALTIDGSYGDNDTRRVVYRLDGSESANGTDPVTLKTTSRWDEDKLVTEGTQTVTTSQGPVSAAFREVRWINDEGVMVIETTRTVEGRDPTTSRAEYAKSTRGMMLWLG